MIDELRNICSNLRPPTIDSLGIVAAIQSHSYEWAKRNNVTLNLSGDFAVVKHTRKGTIFLHHDFENGDIKGYLAVGITQSIESLLTITRLITIFKAYDSVDEALAAFE